MSGDERTSREVVNNPALLKRRRVSIREEDQPAVDVNYVPAPFAQPLQMRKVKNKAKRAQLYDKLRREREKLRRANERRRKENPEQKGDAVVARPQRTLDNTREADVTIVKAADEEVFADEDVDQFASYFDGSVPPRVILTTSHSPSPEAIVTVKELLRVFPNSEYCKRKNFAIKFDMIKWAKNRGYTDLLIWEESTRGKQGIDSLILTHLPNGPTARFRVTSLALPKELRGHGRPTKHNPELVLGRFDARLGRTVGRMLGALFPQNPEFLGRRVVTFHNQRDFIFFRHHRYVFESRKKVRLQELGPRFTLRLQTLQHGTFDTKFGEYEFVLKPELTTSRKRFFL